MNKTQSILILITLSIFTLGISSCDAQIPNAKKVEVHVYGNCGMCKKTIEQAGNKKRRAHVEWDTESKVAVITYNEKKTTADKVLKRIANAGYDNQTYYAPDAVYEALHGCCKYDRKPKTKQ